MKSFGVVVPLGCDRSVPMVFGFQMVLVLVFKCHREVVGLFAMCCFFSMAVMQCSAEGLGVSMGVRTKQQAPIPLWPPKTGRWQVLARFCTEEQKKQWLASISARGVLVEQTNFSNLFRSHLSIIMSHEGHLIRTANRRSS